MSDSHQNPPDELTYCGRIFKLISKNRWTSVYQNGRESVVLSNLDLEGFDLGVLDKLEIDKLSSVEKYQLAISVQSSRFREKVPQRLRDFSYRLVHPGRESFDISDDLDGIFCPLLEVDQGEIMLESWLVESGEEIEEGQPICRLNINSVSFVYESFSTGRLIQSASEKQSLRVGDLIGWCKEKKA